jgi:hypothetical protein
VNFPLGVVQAGREGCVSLAQLDRAGWVREVFLGPLSPFHDGEMAAESAWREKLRLG